MSFNPDTNVCIKDDVTIDNPEGLTYTENLHLGHRIVIQAGGGVTLGRQVAIGEDTVIWSINHDYEEGCLPYGFSRVRKPVVIEDNVWIGRCVMIAPGSHIGEGAVLSLGAVVSGVVPPLAVVAGNPARVVRFRSLERYLHAKINGINLWTQRRVPDCCPSCEPRNFGWRDAAPTVPRSRWRRRWDRFTLVRQERHIRRALASAARSAG
jgi:acetyltransferase-like isoleucine patch superfamily enzyme